MNGQRCPECVKRENRKTTEIFHKEYYEKYPESNIILGEYYNTTEPVECKCKKCGFEWKSMPRSILDNVKCPYCCGTGKYTTETFKRKLNEKYPDNNFIIKSEYVSIRKRINVECAICHKQWYPKAGDLMYGIGCPYCAINKTEKSLGTFLDSLGIMYTIQKKFPDCKNINRLSFDYEINDERFTTFLLEYQGEQHDRPVDFAGKGEEWANKLFKYNLKRDKIKFDYCQKVGYHLEYIWYYEEDKIQALINLLRKYIKPEYDLDKILENVKNNKTA